MVGFAVFSLSVFIYLLSSKPIFTTYDQRQSHSKKIIQFPIDRNE